jgi:flagellar basal body-associated protein FliL
MYAFILFCHSYLRWAIIISLLVVLVRSFGRAKTGRHWTERDERLHVILISLVDVQFLLGLALYFAFSPLTQAFLASPGAGMKNSVIRFFGVEHLTSALIAVAVLHIGRVRSKKAHDPRTRHKRVWVSLAITLVLIAVTIPWPFLPYGRPLFRITTG